MWEKENGVEAGLPGHSYSPKQLFWIAAAQVILQVILNDINLIFLVENQNETKRHLAVSLNLPNIFATKILHLF